MEEVGLRLLWFIPHSTHFPSEHMVLGLLLMQVDLFVISLDGHGVDMFALTMKDLGNKLIK